MGIVKYFFDNYAIIELIKGNPNYAKFIQEEVTLTIFNLAEIYFSALYYISEEAAEEIYEKYRENVVEISDEELKEAMKFRKENMKKRLSYTNCIGYIYAKKNNLIFLTGDREFQGMENVEFIK